MTDAITGSTAWRSMVTWLRGLSADRRDVLLYGMSTVFAGVTAVAMSIPLYREWGRLAVGPYALGTVWMLGVARRRETVARRGGAGVPNGRAWRAARLAARPSREPRWPPARRAVPAAPGR